MRVCLVTETWTPEVNGVARTLKRLVDGLLDRGHELLIVRPRQSKDDRPVEGERYRELLVPGLPLPGYPELRFGFPSPRRLRRTWSEFCPEVVHVATEGPIGWNAVLRARREGIPLTSTFHTNFHVYMRHYGFGPIRAIALRYLRSFHDRTRRTLVPSRWLQELLERERFANVGVLGRGVDTALFDPAKRDRGLRASWGADDDTLVVCYVGRFAPEKNIPLVAYAFEAMRSSGREVRLVLVGDGPYGATLRRDHPDYVFAGVRRGEDLARHYASGDIFLFPSMTETFGNVVTEAMASGLFVVAFDYAAAREHIAHGENGATAPYDDAEAFVAAAIESVRRAEPLAEARIAARKTAEGLSWESIVSTFENELRAVTRSEPLAGTIDAGSEPGEEIGG